MWTVILYMVSHFTIPAYQPGAAIGSGRTHCMSAIAWHASRQVSST
jgi:hypothetical protein